MFSTVQARSAAPIERASNLGNPSASTPASSNATGSGVTRHATRGPRRYPHRLNFYSKPPGSEITIDEFESWAIDRLRVLAEIESSQARNRSLNEMKDIVNAQCKKSLPLNANSAMRSVDLDRERLKDHVSHFVLRLAFCRSEDLRRRFVKAETMLFRLRLESDDALEKEEFLRTLKMDLQLVPEEEKQAHKAELLGATPWLTNTFGAESFFKVTWTRVMDLVEKRRVYLNKGVAWVPMREQSSLILAEFSRRLNDDLEMTARAIPRLDEDDRLLPVLSHLSMGFLAGVTDFTESAIVGEDGAHITADMVDKLVRRHAPMCMRNLHETLSEKKHLKHYGRLQYNLFLKDMGLPIEEALLFWRRSFSLVTDDQFTKEYRYNIRHGYGLEGRKMNYPAKSCARILTQDQPGPQDNHGCPFRHFSTQNLSAALSSQYGLGPKEQSEILGAVKNGHYHVGCTRLFEMTHRKMGVKKGEGLGNGESVSHPNKYFEASWRIRQKREEDGALEVDDEEEEAEEEDVKPGIVKKEEGEEGVVGNWAPGMAPKMGGINPGVGTSRNGKAVSSTTMYGGKMELAKKEEEEEEEEDEFGDDIVLDDLDGEEVQRLKLSLGEEDDQDQKSGTGTEEEETGKGMGTGKETESETEVENKDQLAEMQVDA